MTQYPDMSTKTAVASGSYVRAIGWLENDSAYRRGAVGTNVISRIRQFARRWIIGRKELWWPWIHGFRICELCGRYEAPGYFGVPAGRILYVAPELLLHYVKSEGYVPPTEFCRAVLESPLPGTPEYRAAVKRFRTIRIRAKFPDYYRWKMSHVRFPGVKECLNVANLPTSSYELRLGMAWELYENAGDHADELLAAYQASEDARTRMRLLSVMSDAALAAAIPVFAKHLRSPDEMAKYLAVNGLRKVGNSAARAALRKARIGNQWLGGMRTRGEEE